MPKGKILLYSPLPLRLLYFYNHFTYIQCTLYIAVMLIEAIQIKCHFTLNRSGFLYLSLILLVATHLGYNGHLIVPELRGEI